MVQGSYYSGRANNYDSNRANMVTKIIQKAGTFTYDSNLSFYNGNPSCGDPLEEVFEIYGGTFNWGTEGNEVEDIMDAGLVRIFGGTFNWRVSCNDGSSGKSFIYQFEIYSGGILDASLSVGSDGDKQIGNGDGSISQIFTGGIARFNNGNSNISVESSSSIVNYGGSIVIPDAANLTF